MTDSHRALVIGGSGHLGGVVCATLAALGSRVGLTYHTGQAVADDLVAWLPGVSLALEENFDVSRAMKCCVGVPETDGSNIPTCSYNVLYREKDRRFADPKMLERMEKTRPGLSLPVVQS